MANVLASYDYGIPYFYEASSGLYASTSVWGQAPVLAWLSDPAKWVRFFEDFVNVTVGTNTLPGFAFTAATTGSLAADATVSNGVVKLDAGAVTAGQGVNWQCNQIPVKLHATLPTVFEARVKWESLTSLKVQAFVGLSAISTAIITSNAVVTTDLIGFVGVTTSGVLGTNTTAATTATTGTGKTIANSTYYKFGIVATTAKVVFYVDGVAVSTSITNIPTAALSPSFVNQANATVQPVMHIDYVSVIAPRV